MDNWNLFLQLLVVAAVSCSVLAQGRRGNERRPVTPGPPDNDPVVNPEADEIDQEAFREMFMISGEEVARMVAEADALGDDDSVVDVVPGTGVIVSKPKPPKCKNGPVRTLWRRPGYWYFPPIRVTRCRRLPCPNNAPCLAKRTVTRDVWAICFKRFNCWGLILWIPIGIQRLCVIDESDCDCQKCSDIKDYRTCVNRQPCPEEGNVPSFCYWKPFQIPDTSKIASLNALSTQATTDQIANSVVDPCLWGSCDCCRETPCPPNQFFDRRLCMCRCMPTIFCPPPFIVHPEACQCICPATNNCGPRRKWNPVTCQCECKPYFCFPPRIPNQKRCQCQCPFRNCTLPLVHDPTTCECTCPKILICSSDEFLNPDTCQCECLPVSCPTGFTQDNETCDCVCDRECPTGFTLDPNTCLCVCDRDCLPIFTLDEDTCTCICELECQPNFTLDSDNCTCVCERECPPTAPLDPKTCDCICNIKECPPDFTLDLENCTCLCDRECPLDFTLDPDTCQCRCDRICPTGFILDPFSCQCRCDHDRICPTGFTLDPVSCQCRCDRICPTGFTLDQDTCQCRCDRICPTGFTLDQDTCQCRCDRECPDNFVLDPDTCECVCKLECPTGSIPDPDTCNCTKVVVCEQITDENDCNNSFCKSSSLLPNRCLWFPDDTNSDVGRCKCNCCVKVSMVPFDCSELSCLGQQDCVAARDPDTNTSPCSWNC